MSVVPHREHCPRRARRAAPGFHHRDQEHAPAGIQPFGALAQDFEIDAIHGDLANEGREWDRRAKRLFGPILRPPRPPIDGDGGENDNRQANSPPQRAQPRRSLRTRRYRGSDRSPDPLDESCEEVVGDLGCRRVDQARADLRQLAAHLRVRGIVDPRPSGLRGDIVQDLGTSLPPPAIGEEVLRRRRLHHP